MKRTLVVLCALVSIAISSYFAITSLTPSGFVAEASTPITEGSLQLLSPEGQPIGLCPLKHTDVRAEISGFISRVTVTQQFENPFKEKIEAVYTFPLPQNAAVDDLTMRIGERVVRGKIKQREEARVIYEAARRSGRTASLLDQERPNIFTQSVANILPGEPIKIEISYIATLSYEDGAYEFVFPMVVGPRYNPGAPVGKQGGGFSPDTTKVPDASRITPRAAPKAMRAGHDISIEVALDAGVPIESFASKSHAIESQRLSERQAVVRLQSQAVIPNKDFILKYDVAGGRIEDAVLTHHSQQGGFFTLILQPPDRVTAADVTPKELVFVLDTSGSMSGFPIEKAKEAMKHALDGLYPEDTFNLITFAGDTNILFPEPVQATPANLRRAQAFLASRSGGGGTEMMTAIRAALEPSDSQKHMRIVCFMTDGYVGNDMEIIGEVQKHPNARVFSFGIGGSVNRYLLDKMAEHGRGEVEYVSLDDDGSAAAKRFHERIHSPLLTDVSIEWAGLPVTDVYPKRLPDLFSAKPLVVCGRFTGNDHGAIQLKGKAAGREFVRYITVDLPANEPRHDVLAKLWARTRIDELMSQDFNGVQAGNPRPEVKEAITQLGLDFRLMTQFTSFVAVEEMVVTDGGEPRRIEVPVEMPEGVSHEGVFGQGERVRNGYVAAKRAPQAYRSTSTGQGASTGSGNGYGPGQVSNQPAGTATSVPSPPPPRPQEEAVLKLRDEEQPLTQDQLKERSLRAKLHPSIVAVIERLKIKDSLPSDAEAKFVRNGKAEVQVWLVTKSDAVIATLKRLGFEVILDPKNSKMIVGRIALDKLKALAESSAVVYISPQL